MEYDYVIKLSREFIIVIKTHSQQHIANRVWISNGAIVCCRLHAHTGIRSACTELTFTDVIKSVEHRTECINKSEAKMIVYHMCDLHRFIHYSIYD